MIVKKDEQIKPNINTRKQIIKIIVKINELQNRKTVVKNIIQNSFFEKISKIENL